MPRGEQHDRARVRDQHVLECFQQERFFTLDGASADQHRASAGGGQRGSQVGNNGRCGRQAYIKLEIAAHLHAFRSGADRCQASAIRFGLSEEQIDVLQFFF